MPRPKGVIPNLKIPQSGEAKTLSKIFDEVDRIGEQRIIDDSLLLEVD